MGASNTPIPDLIELSGIAENTTYTADGSGGGSILGVVDNATYTDSDGSNTATNIAELNESSNGSLNIGGTTYNIQLANPESNVNYGFTGGGSGTINDDGDESDIVFIIATPQGGGTTRYFALFDDSVGDIDGLNSLRTGELDFTPAGNDVMIDVDQDNSVSVVCFLEGTRIDTPKGPRLVEDLAPNDLVLTLDHGPQSIRWTHRRSISAAQLAANPNLAPVRIDPGALGQGLPQQTLFLSFQHRVLLRSKIAARLFGSSEVLVPAGKLLAMPGITRDARPAPYTYHHFMCDDHEVVLANGAPCETLMRGDEAFRTLEGSARTAWQLLRRTGRGPVRPIRARARDIERLVLRHARNGKPLFHS